MQITKAQIDDLNAVLTVKVEKADYTERVEKILKDYRKKARFDGFRPGKVPQGLVNKLYYKPVLIEEVNKLLGESLGKYLMDEKLNILGEPLPNEDKQVQIDWDHDADFQFSFDIGIAPEVDFTISDKDKIAAYLIRVDEDEIKLQVDRIRTRFGSRSTKEEITGNEIITADLVESDKKGNAVEGGMKVEGVSFSLERVNDDKINKRFQGKRKGDLVVVDMKKAFTDETELAGLLKIEKEKLGDIHPDFQVNLVDISAYEKADVNQDLFDKVYGKDVVKSEDEFMKRVEAEMRSAFERNSEYRFRLDAKEFYLKKFKQDLPVTFIKRWILQVNEGKLNREQVDQDFDHYAEDLKWQLLKSKFIKDFQLKVEESELFSHVKEQFRQQFIQYYGIADVPAETLDNFARESLKKEDERNRYITTVLENKVYDHIRKTANLDTKEITLEKFNKTFEK
jgi:trigger factor